MPSKRTHLVVHLDEHVPVVRFDVLEDDAERLRDNGEKGGEG